MSLREHIHVIYLTAFAALGSAHADTNPGPPEAGPGAVQVTVEVLEFDCLNATTDLVKCNSVLRSARSGSGDTEVLSAVTPQIRKMDYTGLLYPDRLLKGEASAGDSRLELKIETGAPVDGRYQVDFRARYVRESNRLSVLSSSMVITPGSGPQRVGGGMTDRAVAIKGKERRVAKYELILLSLDTP